MSEEAKTYWFEVRETTVRDAQVTAQSLTQARRLMREYVAGHGDADMGGTAPIQLGDLQSVKMTARAVSAPKGCSA